MHRSILLLLMLVQITTACDTKEVPPDPERVGYNFFPLALGLYSIYQVENVEYRNTGEEVTSTYALKAAVVDSFTNLSGTTSYIIHYFRRAADTDPWQFTRAWTARKNRTQAVVTEENVPFLKLSFPVKTGQDWDGNVLNSSNPDIYHIDSLSGRYITPAQDTIIGENLTVVQEDNQDYISQLDKRFEIYARDIGLIYKEDVQLNYCTDPDCLGQEVVESGWEYRQYLVEYGSL